MLVLFIWKQHRIFHFSFSSLKSIWWKGFISGSVFCLVFLYNHKMHANKKGKTLNVGSNTLDRKSKYHQHFVFTLEFRMKYYPVKISTSVCEWGSSEVCPQWTMVTYIINDSRLDTSGNVFVQPALYKVFFQWKSSSSLGEEKSHTLPVSKDCREVSGKWDQCLPLLQLPIWVPLDKLLTFSCLWLPQLQNKDNSLSIFHRNVLKFRIVKSWGMLIPSQ